ncbi:MAG: YitT family protein [Clostridia bacterium]|nr:YitT family protein [Clostridia bacterium]
MKKKEKPTLQEVRDRRLRRRNAFRSISLDILGYALGAVLYAISVDVFTSPNNIAPGGVTGVATILHTLYDVPIGMTSLLINVPLFILGFIFIGWKYIGRTMIALSMSSIAIDALVNYIPTYEGDTMLAAVFGGTITGIALGIIFMRGGSTGGTDIIARLLGKIFPYITQGTLIMIADAAVIITAACVYGLEGALYSTVSLVVSSFVVDRVLYGLDTGKFMFIVSNKSREISHEINKKIERGTTLLKGTGGYSGGEHEIVMCAVRRNEVYKIRALIRSIDPAAFLIIGEATEILGQGFKDIKLNEFGETEKVQ